MLEARVGIEPTHKGFADLYTAIVTPVFSTLRTLRSSFLSEICTSAEGKTA
jgi:hypothetical protein